MYNEVEGNELARVRNVNEAPYLSKGLINAYLDERLKPTDKKKFESLVGNMEELKEQLRVKHEVRSFLSELIPESKISKKSMSSLNSELKDVADSVLGEDKVSLSGRIAHFLDKTILEF